MFRNAKTSLNSILIFFVFGVLSTSAYAQHYADRATSYAEGIKEESRIRVDRAKAQIDDTLDWLRNSAVESSDLILSAEYKCINSKTVQIQNKGEAAFEYVMSEIQKIERDNEFQSRSINRKFEIVQDSYRRTCNSNASENLEAYARCVIAAEKANQIAAIVSAMKRLDSMQRLFIDEPLEKYRACSSKKGGINESSFTPVSQAAFKTTALINGYMKKLNDSSETLLGNR